MGLAKGILAAAFLPAIFLVGVPSVASATVYTPGAGEFTLDHFYAYTWKITNVTVPVNQTVTSASLTFKNIYNWDNNANELFLHLFDTANQTTTVRSLQDESTDNTNFNDAFTNASVKSYYGNSWLVGSTTADTFLTSRSFAGLGRVPGSNPDGETNATSLYGWSTGAVSAGTCLAGTTYTSGGITKCKGSGDCVADLVKVGTVFQCQAGYYYDYTYTFDATEITKLQSYIGNGNDIAIGFDPDCHYYNDGVSLTINTGPASIPAVPEPASVMLVGSGLAWLARRARRRGLTQ